MPRNGSGTYSRSNGAQTGTNTWQNARDAGVKILASQHDTHDQDIADAINDCPTKDGKVKMQASWVPNTDASYDLGTISARWQQGYFSGSIKFGTTAATGTLGYASLGGARTWTLPDASGTLSVPATDETITGTKTFTTTPVISGSDRLEIRPRGTNTGETGAIVLRELAANGSSYVGFRAPDSLSTSTEWRLPTADGSVGQALTTDGSGNLAFSTVSTAGFLGLFDLF